ncbi:hypothetical protein L9F63_006053 [Diploptera punctata]|uniref:C2H2-type domain-containing protein n=1 Tax=Diploptera punctata TaxID=6984 RepID=A0AAD7ZCB5_DIPPU|nr:hypothetical protein L9F63_006053 [Diploptera punctata]
MNCEVSIKHEDQVSADTEQDIKVEIKSEEDQIGNVDTKYVAFATVDTLASAETNLEESCSEESSEQFLENSQINTLVKFASSVVCTEESACSGNINNADGMYAPNQSSQKGHKDLTHNICEDEDYSIRQVGKSFKCSICNKFFSQKSNLNTHLRLHSNYKPFKCHVCNMLFSQKWNLYRHIRMHSNEKPFKCSVCNKSFGQKSHLISHIPSHIIEKSFKCHFCDKLFAHETYLNNHLPSHHNEKPFVCSFCGKSYFRKSVLTRHLRMHNDEKQYKCAVCNKSFHQKFNLNRHLHKLFKCK